MNLRNILLETSKEIGTDYAKSGLGIMTAVKLLIYTIIALFIGGFIAGLYALFF